MNQFWEKISESRIHDKILKKRRQLTETFWEHIILIYK